jgi:hypothetical protein
MMRTGALQDLRVIDLTNDIGRHQLKCFPAVFRDTTLDYAIAPFLREHNFDMYKELLGMSSDEENAIAIGEDCLPKRKRRTQHESHPYP